MDEHSTEADLPKITATAYREDFSFGVDDGIVVPEVFARLVEHEHSNTFDQFSIMLGIIRPGEASSAQCYLNLHEAGLLAKALHELVRTHTPRRNEKGEQIGPDMRIDLMLVDVVYAASGAIERAREEAVTTAITQHLAGEAVQREQTARFTWRDLVSGSTYARDLPELLDISRSGIGDLSASLGRRVDAEPAIGGLLMWNRTRDMEAGHLAMITGQTPEQEHQVLENAGWMVSCGAVYAGSRLGWHRKPKPDTQFQLDPENRMWVWLLPHDRDVDGMLR